MTLEGRKWRDICLDDIAMYLSEKAMDAVQLADLFSLAAKRAVDG